jgi:hypothetical protein
MYMLVLCGILRHLIALPSWSVLVLLISNSMDPGSRQGGTSQSAAMAVAEAEHHALRSSGRATQR